MRGGIIILSRFWKLILKMYDERTVFEGRNWFQYRKWVIFRMIGKRAKHL